MKPQQLWKAEEKVVESLSINEGLKQIHNGGE